jgi:hypothetical protein
MRNLLTDLCVESEAHTFNAMYMARTFDRYFYYGYLVNFTSFYCFLLHFTAFHCILLYFAAFLTVVVAVVLVSKC